jgi:endoglucanase
MVPLAELFFARMKTLLSRLQWCFGSYIVAPMNAHSHRFFMKLASSVIIILFIALGISLAPLAEAAGQIETWWPTDGAQMQGVQPFKAVIDGLDVSSYDMYWQVDGGTLNPMQNSSDGYPHKEASVDISGWTWHGTGPYRVTFVAKQNGTVVADKSMAIYSGATTVTSTAAPGTSSSASASTSTAPSSSVTISQPAPAPAAPAGASTVSVWWPTQNAVLSGTQPFKAVITDRNVDTYSLYWQVDGGGQNTMPTNYSGTPHKEATVDVSSWHWQTSGTYTLTFTAKDASGATIATYSEPITANAQSVTTVSAPPASAPIISPTPPAAPSTGQTLSSSSFYVDPNSNAAATASLWAVSNPTDAAKMQLLAHAPTAKWFGEWSGDVASAVRTYVQAASSVGKTPVLVAYDIPGRDCGGYSAGGSANYLSWISSFAQGIGSSRAVVILEPDALAQMSCLSSTDQAARYTLLTKAVTLLKANAGTTVYIDAGHAGWIDPSTMAQELRKANVGAADGFSLNVSNYDATPSETAYGSSISSALGGTTHYVIDTSRNGNGSNGQWCNASGRAIGTLPTTQTNTKNLDAFLWIKTPGESDGTCNGGPSAGSWWASYALGLVNNQH